MASRRISRRLVRFLLVVYLLVRLVFLAQLDLDREAQAALATYTGEYPRVVCYSGNNQLEYYPAAYAVMPSVLLSEASDLCEAWLP